MAARIGGITCDDIHVQLDTRCSTLRCQQHTVRHTNTLIVTVDFATVTARVIINSAVTYTGCDPMHLQQVKLQLLLHVIGGHLV